MDIIDRLSGVKWESLLLILLAVSFLLGGSYGFLFSTRGGIVPPQDRIELVAHGQQGGSWRTRSVLMEYHYDRNSNRLRISGNLEFGSYLRNVYHYIVYFHSGVLLLNDHGRVLATRNLMTASPYAHSSGLERFHATYHLPPGTTAFAFTYTGTARAIPTGSTSFYHYP